MKTLLSRILLLACLVSPVRTSAQLIPGGGTVPVIDIAAIAKLVEQIGNQVRTIAILRQQLQDMLQNTVSLGIGGYWDILTLLNQLQAALQHGNAIAYPLQHALSLLRTVYPGYHIPEIWLASYQLWTLTQMATQAGTMALLHRLALEAPIDQLRLQGLAGASTNAIGRLAAIQAGNNIAIEQIQQTLRLREVIMADANARLIESSQRTNEEASRVAIDVELIKNVGVPWRSDMTGGIGTIPYPQ
jgi:P-type conjugative transfer protein TrbJ